MKRKRILNIGITFGDPAGVGPEIALKSLPELSKDTEIRPILIGRKSVIDKNYPDLPAPDHVLSMESFTGKTQLDGPAILDLESSYPVPDPGHGSIETGAESLSYIKTALDLWKAGLIDAMVTGPVHKGFIEKSGTPFTGHTEFIADYIGERGPLMMMFSPEYRVLLATTHIPLEHAAEHVTKERLLHVIRAGYESMKAIDGGDVRLAVTGFDPHCGDDGAIGDFDLRITKPAVDEARASGIQVEGPFSADTLFMPEKWSSYNLVIVHYHDQGLIPFKVLAFDRGVNVTLGLSIVRTSVDHGTAFDIAGKGIARYSSMIEAVNVAKMLVRARQR